MPDVFDKIAEDVADLNEQVLAWALQEPPEADELLNPLEGIQFGISTSLLAMRAGECYNNLDEIAEMLDGFLASNLPEGHVMPTILYLAWKARVYAELGQTDEDTSLAAAEEDARMLWDRLSAWYGS